MGRNSGLQNEEYNLGIYFIWNKITLTQFLSNAIWEYIGDHYQWLVATAH